MTFDEVQEAFIAAPPLISKQITDLSISHPNWFRDLYKKSPWPDGNGTQMEQLAIRGGLPNTERGFEAWKLLSNNTGCDPCAGPDCGYNISPLGGHGIDRKITTLMSREFVSPSYCVTEIQTTAHWEQIFSFIVTNLYRQIDYIKEINIGQNALVSVAKKYIVDSDGPKPNPANPYVYRNIGTARLSMLNIDMLEFFYEAMRYDPTTIPYDMQNGAPLFSMACSAQLLSRLYRDDPSLRQDARFSSEANALLNQYNFISTIRGMFIAAPIQYPRRFKIVAGEPVEVLPYVNNIPSEVGAYTGINGDYVDSSVATHEEVIFNGKDPFEIFYMPTKTTLGSNTSFGPEYSFFDSFMWVNPQTVQDPLRRNGFFITSAKIGLSQQWSEGVFAVLVERPKKALAAAWIANPACPPEDVVCDNSVPDVACPCPLILSVKPNPVVDGNYFVTLAVPRVLAPAATVDLGVSTGGYATATVVDSSADDLVHEVTFAVDIPACDIFTTIFCDNTLGCSATVTAYELCGTGANVDLILSNPIKVDAADVITLFFSDGTSDTSVTVVGQNMLTNTLTVTAASIDVDCLNKATTICVPTSVDATCPGCDQSPTYAECAT